MALTPCFEDYIEETNRAGTVDALFNILLKHLNRQGLDRAMFVMLSNDVDIGAEAGVGLIHNYPPDWIAYYKENGFDLIDPVTIYAMHHVGAFEWRELPCKLTLTQKQKLVLKEGEEAGLHNGACTSFRGPRNQLAGFGLATSEKADAFSGNLDMVTALCNHFYIAFRRLNKISRNPDDNIYLTEREREILTWAAVGKTDEEIGAILSVSTHTVDFHLRNIRRKLNANGRILAVVKAVSLGLIAP